MIVLRIKYLSFFFLISSLQAQVIDTISIKTADSLITLSGQYSQRNEVVKAIQIADSLITLSEFLPEYKGDYIRSRAYNIIGHSNLFLDDKEASLTNFQNALGFARNVHNDSLEIRILNNIGGLYVAKYQDYKAGLKLYTKGLKMAKEIGNPIMVDMLSLNIGENHMLLGNFKEALRFLKPILDKVETYKNPYYKSFVYQLMARYYLSQELYTKASLYTRKAISLDEQLAYLEGIHRDYKLYAELFGKERQYDSAYYYLSKAAIANDSLKKQQNKAQRDIISAKFRLEEYKRNLNQLKKENIQVTKKSNTRKKFNLINIFVSVILVLLLATLLYFFLERRKTQKQLVEQNKALEVQKNRAEQLAKTKSQFISTVSHELRTPMYGVIGLTSILLENSNLMAKDREYLKSLKFSSDYLLNLINDVLEISKIESKEIQLQATPFNLKKLLENIVKPFKNDAVERKNKIHLIIPPTIPKFLLGDSVRLSQILFNLIGNAVKFTEAGDIWIRLSLLDKTSEEARILFEVEDNGPGIPEDQHEKIFESFAQLERYNTQTSFKGTGLGLAIVTKLLLLFESKIQLKSEVGKGTTFGFELAMKIADSAENKEEKQKDLTFDNYKILVVEDNKISQIVTCKILEKVNMSCTIVENGRDAVDAVKNHKYDLILMDLHMPVMDGITATKIIREFNTEIPIIALTASDIEDADQELLQMESMTTLSSLLIIMFFIKRFISIAQKQYL